MCNVRAIKVFLFNHGTRTCTCFSNHIDFKALRGGESASGEGEGGAGRIQDACIKKPVQVPAVSSVT